MATRSFPGSCISYITFRLLVHKYDMRSEEHGASSKLFLDWVYLNCLRVYRLELASIPLGCNRSSHSFRSYRFIGWHPTSCELIRCSLPSHSNLGRRDWCGPCILTWSRLCWCCVHHPSVFESLFFFCAVPHSFVCHYFDHVWSRLGEYGPLSPGAPAGTELLPDPS